MNLSCLIYCLEKNKRGTNLKTEELINSLYSLCDAYEIEQKRDLENHTCIDRVLTPLKNSHIFAVREAIRKIKTDYSKAKPENFEWPENIMTALGIALVDTPTPEQIKGVEHIIGLLKERERNILIKRYKEKQTLEAISKEMNISKQCVQMLVMHALRKLRLPERIHIAEEGIDALEECRRKKTKLKTLSKEYSEQIEKLIHDTTLFNLVLNGEPTEAYVKELKKIWDGKDVIIIEGEKSRLGVGNDLFELTVVSYNALRRAGYSKIGDLAGITKEKLFKIRNIGTKSVKEITEALGKFGIDVKDNVKDNYK